MKLKDGWSAQTSDGKNHYEVWIAGNNSPWTELMNYCKVQKEYVTGMQLVLGGKMIGLPINQEGYWQSHAIHHPDGLPEVLQRGIGYVAGGICNIYWGLYTAEGNPFFFEEKRLPKDPQIIWSND